MDKYRFDFFCHGCIKSKAYCEKNCITKYTTKRFKKDEYIAYKGETVKSLALLVTGEVTISTVMDSGMVLITRHHKAPTPFGAVALFSERNYYRVDIQAKNECEIIYITKEEIELHIEMCRTFMRNYIAHTTNMVDIFAEHLNILTHNGLRAKLAYYILVNSKGDKYSLDKKIADIANYLCVERPSLSRVIAQFVNDKLITYERGSGEILDVSALRNML